jgi:hypothetical protein
MSDLPRWKCHGDVDHRGWWLCNGVKCNRWTQDNLNDISDMLYHDVDGCSLLPQPHL